jgi:L-ascorbate metabolism protein UlaG (beta-lactamase superfamily)
MTSSSLKRAIKRAVLLTVLFFLAFVLVAYLSAFRSLGAAPSGERLARMNKSKSFSDGRFENPEPLKNHFWLMVVGMFHASEHVTPSAPLRGKRLSRASFEVAPASGLRVTWFGHSSTLVELDGHRILTDPVWSERASPISWLGPKRFAATLLPLEELPHLDAVVISHDHYDHLDRATVESLASRGIRLIVPLGVGAHLEYWGVPSTQITELDWWESVDLGELRVVCTPARHASGRFLFDKDRTLWAGYALLGPQHRVYYSGDTGLFNAMREIGERLGPFDLAMIETGQYNQAWPDWHIGPEQAQLAHQWVRGKQMLPVHWALFGLAYHGWTEPIERSVSEAERRSTPLVTPELGETFEPAQAASIRPWWPQLPYETAADAPILSTKVDRVTNSEGSPL